MEPNSDKIEVVDGMIEMEIGTACIDVDVFEARDAIRKVATAAGDGDEGTYLAGVAEWLSNRHAVTVSWGEADLFTQVILRAYELLKKRHSEIAGSLRCTA